MIKCPFCGATHLPNTIFCGECGTYLLEDIQHGTDPLGTEEIAWVGIDEEEGESQAAKGADSTPVVVRFIVGSNRRIIEISLNKVVHIGRLDPATDIFPEIDLTDDGGLEKGVSRRHARILKREGLIIAEDLGSINGTFLNGKRLAPYLPEQLHDGDQLQLGKLLIDIELS
jgi:pSer/pThr/pTyr-binding forkhead associated (FHA) protein